MKKQILFVDDEPRVLQGLRRMLRGLRHEWDMEFAEGAHQALQQLAAKAFDVVVSDMRMPAMDGAQLLEQVARLYPGTVRIILSGHCSRDTVLKCVGPTHQFLTKPCDSERVRATVARACRLRDHLGDELLKAVVSRAGALPAQPAVYAELIAELESPQASIDRAAEIVARDVAMTAKVLQLVSSGFFGTPQRLAEPAQAVVLLGLDTVKPLVLSARAIASDVVDGVDGELLTRLSTHSRAVATAAAAIAEAETDDPLLIGDARLAGYLHEVGILALAQDDAATAKPFPPADDSHSDAALPEVGAYLMALWGLADPIVKAIAFHRTPRRSGETSFSPLTALHVAEALLEDPLLEQTPPLRLDLDYLDQLGCGDRLETWRRLCQETPQVCQETAPQGVSP